MIILRNKAYILSPFVLGFLFAASTAYACGQCQMAAAWVLFPPIITWGWIGMGWFLSLAITADLWGKKIPHIPSFGLGLVYIICGLVACLAMLGPLSTLPFHIPAFRGMRKVLRDTGAKYTDAEDGKWRPVPQADEIYPDSFKKAILTFSIIAFLGVGGTSIWELSNPTPRDPLNVILNWGGTSWARFAMNDLQEAEPASLPDYRIIVKQADLYSAYQAAERLAILGDPATDAPLLIEALARANRDKYGTASDEIEAALRTLTGLSLPAKTSAVEWEQAWKNRLKEIAEEEADK